jgi:hypothetical protein
MAGLNGPDRNEFQPGVSFGINEEGDVNDATGGSPSLPGVSVDGLPNCSSNGLGSVWYPRPLTLLFPLFPLVLLFDALCA